MNYFLLKSTMSRKSTFPQIRSAITLKAEKSIMNIENNIQFTKNQIFH